MVGGIAMPSSGFNDIWLNYGRLTPWLSRAWLRRGQSATTISSLWIVTLRHHPSAYIFVSRKQLRHFGFLFQRASERAENVPKLNDTR